MNEQTLNILIITIIILITIHSDIVELLNNLKRAI
jgi:hypothetical protein